MTNETDGLRASELCDMANEEFYASPLANRKGRSLIMAKEQFARDFVSRLDDKDCRLMAIDFTEETIRRNFGADGEKRPFRERLSFAWEFLWG